MILDGNSRVGQANVYATQKEMELTITVNNQLDVILARNVKIEELQQENERLKTMIFHLTGKFDEVN